MYYKESCSVELQAGCSPRLDLDGGVSFSSSLRKMILRQPADDTTLFVTEASQVPAAVHTANILSASYVSNVPVKDSLASLRINIRSLLHLQSDRITGKMVF